MPFLQGILEDLYDFNHRPEHWDMPDNSMLTRQDRSNIHQWGSPLHRRVVEAICKIAFLCMLRVDEVLKIEMHHMVIKKDRITLTLPFRKTHQFGGEFTLFPFHLLIYY